MQALERNPKFLGRKGPVVLVIMDGVGIGKYKEGDAVLDSPTPFLHKLMKTLPFTTLKAHGTAVGLPSDADMGNSEVGHNAMGCGRVFAQGAKLVSEAIKSGKMFEGATWKKAVEEAKKGGTMHFIGLFSDGNVHSHIDHLKGMIERAKAEGVKKVRIHALLDGRDVPETSALDYVVPFEEYLKEINAQGFDYRFASGGGRMNITMDRYGANWDMVRRGWETHVAGKGRYFKTVAEAIETLRAETKAIDQDLPPFVIADDGKTPVGAVKDGDVVIYFNFRGDRAIEISEAFDNPDFDKFPRDPMPKVFYAGMMEYDGDLHIPNHYLVNPPEINETLGELPLRHSLGHAILRDHLHALHRRLYGQRHVGARIAVRYGEHVERVYFRPVYFQKFGTGYDHLPEFGAADRFRHWFLLLSLENGRPVRA